MTSWVVTTPGPAGQGDGIADYAARLAEALDATVLMPGTPAPPVDAIAGVLHQYSPHASPASLRQWVATVARQGRPVVLTIHEFWPPPDGSLKRAVRRFQLRRRVTRLGHAADAVVVTQEIAARELLQTGVVPAAPSVIAVGSNITCSSGPRQRDGGIVIFGQPASYEPEFLAAVDRWRRTITPVPSLTWVSRSYAELLEAWRDMVGGDLSGVSLRGALPEAEVSDVLAQATMAVAPYRGGGSGRRTTLAALLEHGVPTVTIDGPAADGWVRGGDGVCCVSEPTSGRFADAVAALWSDHARRDDLAEAAKRTHASRLSWPVLAAAYRTLMAATKERRT